MESYIPVFATSLLGEFPFSDSSHTGKGDKTGREAALASFRDQIQSLDTGHVGAEADTGALLCAVGGRLPAS